MDVDDDIDPEIGAPFERDGSVVASHPEN